MWLQNVTLIVSFPNMLQSYIHIEWISRSMIYQHIKETQIKIKIIKETKLKLDLSKSMKLSF